VDDVRSAPFDAIDLAKRAEADGSESDGSESSVGTTANEDPFNVPCFLLLLMRHNTRIFWSPVCDCAFIVATFTQPPPAAAPLVSKPAKPSSKEKAKLAKLDKKAAGKKTAATGDQSAATAAPQRHAQPTLTVTLSCGTASSGITTAQAPIGLFANQAALIRQLQFGGDEPVVRHVLLLLVRSEGGAAASAYYAGFIPDKELRAVYKSVLPPGQRPVPVPPGD
jgi:hypothetical protein